MKYKPKIKYKLMAALVAAFSLFCLSIPASAAYQGNNGGLASANWSDTNPPIGYATGVDSFAWRADLYVSTNEDGKIKESDYIGNQLALVGSVLCTTSGLTSHYGTTYIQTNYTNEMGTRDSFDPKGSFTSTDSEGNMGVTMYTLPTLTEFNADQLYYKDASGHTVAIANKSQDMDSVHLFDNQYKVPTSFQSVQDALTKDEAKANEYTTEILEQLSGKYGLQPFLEAVFSPINIKIQNTIVEQANTDGLSFGDAVKKYLFPTSPDCMVEWALVVTPMIHFHSDTAFYCAKDSASSLKHNGCELPYVSNHDYIALDAYWFAQSDVTSIALGKDGWYKGQTYGNPGTELYINPNTGKEIGVLSRFLRDTTGSGQHYASAVASAAYSTEKKCDPYLGVFNNDGNVAQTQWYSLLQSKPADFAKRGGIAVFTTKITTPDAPVYYHTYTYRIDENDKDSLPSGYTPGTFSTDDPNLLKFLNELDAPTVTVTKGTLPEGNTFYPKKGAEDLELNGLVVAAVSPQPTLNPQPGNQDEYPILSTTDTYLERVLDSTEAQLNPTNPLADTATLKTGKATPDNTADDPKEFHVKIVHIEVIPEVPTVTTPSLRDRIKSYDVTQLIEDTKQTIEAAKGRYGGNKHINLLSTYKKDDYGEYNKSTFESIKHTDTGTAKDYKTLAVIKSIDKHNPSVTHYAYDTTYAKFTDNCPWDCGGSWSSCWDDINNSTTPPTIGKHHSSTSYCGEKCDSTLHTCTYLEDYITTAYGAKPTQKFRWEKKSYNSMVSQHTNWKAPTALPSGEFAKVGFVIPEAYYSNANVVKLSGSNKIYSNNKYYLNLNNSTITLNGITADKVASLDVLLGYNNSDEDFFIRYVDINDAQIGTKDHVQYDEFAYGDKKEDVTEAEGKSAWDYMSGSHADIYGAKFISHRDYITGADVQTSLVVSGYMARYGYNAQTNTYLDFMKNAGFTFSGAKNITSSAGSDKNIVITTDSLNSSAKVVNVANALEVISIAEKYNHHYTVPDSDKQMVKFGLGGTKADGGDIYTHIEKAGNLENLELTTSGGNETKGDVARSIWYYPEHRDSGDSALCNGYHTGYSHTAKSNHKCSCGAGGASCSTHIVKDTLGNKHSKWVSDSKGATGYQYIGKSGSYYIVDKMYGSHTVLAINGTQTEAVSAIETSRLSFLIPLAVEGTIAGQWDATGANGLNYNSDKLELKNGALRYKDSSDKVEQTWRKTTFEMVKSHYADVGDENRTLKNSKDVLAEYRYSIPTKTFKFNPSYYMQFDKGFEDPEQNQSVWMLSNQPREINFKDILDIRLIQPTTDATSKGAKSGYVTTINSEWSTDKTDNDILKKTGLPTIKAGNAYTTSTDKTEGTITMYVVLQDPEFASPNHKTEIENYNNNVMKSYQETVNKILADLKLNGFQMYTNAVNGSSKGSGMQVHTGSYELTDKEPMKIANSVVTVTNNKGNNVNDGATADFSDWKYYALKGNTFSAQLNGDKFGEGIGFDENTDISDTVKNRKISINGNTYAISTMKDNKIAAHIKTTLTELNDRLTGIMSAPQYSPDRNKQDRTAIPTNYKPYADWDTESNARAFDWYGEDYEGFVVAVYNIQFSRETKNAFYANGEANLSKTTTSPATIYRHESDWQSKTNEDAHELITPSYKINGVDNLYASTNTKVNNLTLGSDGKIELLTKAGKLQLTQWAKSNSKVYANKIYGMGMELRIPVVMSNSASCAGNKSISSASNPNGKVSFFYQPTYFNIRGSVYDTAR